MTDGAQGLAGRRRILAGLTALAAGAIAKLTAAGRAEANANATLSAASTAAYGVLASPGTSAPIQPTLGSTTHAVIGSNSAIATAPIGSGVFGARNGAGLAGVLGVNASDGTGVYGGSDSGTGIEGHSVSGDGILGFSSGNLKYSLAGSGSGQAHGLIGFSVNQFGVAGINQRGTNYAGFFSGGEAANPGVLIDGTLIATGVKSQAVPTGRDGMRKLYAVEATQPLFEDFGSARLENGRAEVRLDPVFAATVNTGIRYQVFLTPRSAETTGLAVVAQDAGGFTVQEIQGGRGSYEFDYRVMARVRGHEQTRLEPFTRPPVPTPPTDTLAQLRRRAPARPAGVDD